MDVKSLGWEHYEVHEPEPHILLFKYGRSTTLQQNCANEIYSGVQSTTNLQRHSKSAVLTQVDDFAVALILPEDYTGERLTWILKDT